jgi:hypothetical protein
MSNGPGTRPSSPLADRIHLELVGRPGLRVTEIARRLQIADKKVRDVLASDGRFVSRPRNAGRGLGWFVAATLADGRGRARRTHDDRVLELLSDGRPHSHLEIYRLGVVGHSRISSLRSKGFLIESWREGDLYLYQLGHAAPSSAPHACDTASKGDGASSCSPVEEGSVSPLTLPGRSLLADPSSTGEQLSLTGATA